MILSFGQADDGSARKTCDSLNELVSEEPGNYIDSCGVFLPGSLRLTANIGKTSLPKAEALITFL